MSGQHAAAAQAAWGDELPHWVLLLAQQCDATSLRRAAGQLRYSASTISYVINRKYPGRYDAVEAAVKGAFMSGEVSCPVLGQIRVHVCTEHQRARFANTNSIRVRLFRACRDGCPHSFIKPGVAAGKETP